MRKRLMIRCRRMSLRNREYVQGKSATKGFVQDIILRQASTCRHTHRHTQIQTQTHTQTDRHRQTQIDRHRHTHTDRNRQTDTDRLKQPQVKDGPQARLWAIRHSRQVARCREPKQKLNLYSPVEAPRRCEGLGKQPVVPKQVVSVARVCKGLDCKSRASCEAGCDRFR